MNSSKVSILIPTLNSARTLEKTLASIQGQDYENIQVLISDSGSSDGTINVVSRYGFDLLNTGPGLLNARIEGIKHASGVYTLLLDSDMVLKPHSIERAVSLAQTGYDLVFLEESPMPATGLIEKMWSAERQLIYSIRNCRVDPLNGDLLPRFFRTNILKSAANNIPRELTSWLRHPDHQIIYYECYKISHKVAFLDNAVYFYERSNLSDLVRTYFRHGKDAAKLQDFGEYSELVKSKVSAKFNELIGSRRLFPYIALLLLIKGVPFVLGSNCARVATSFKRYRR